MPDMLPARAPDACLDCGHRKGYHLRGWGPCQACDRIGGGFAVRCECRAFRAVGSDVLPEPAP